MIWLSGVSFLAYCLLMASWLPHNKIVVAAEPVSDTWHLAFSDQHSGRNKRSAVSTQENSIYRDYLLIAER